MKNWEDLTFVQKVVIGIGILAIAVFAPEIALLLQFGGIEVAFAFLFLASQPLITWIHRSYAQIKDIANVAITSLSHSKSATPRVFALQSTFCCIAFALTGSDIFAFSFFMPSMLLNGLIA